MASQNNAAGVAPEAVASGSQSTPKQSLHALGWPELLRRFSEAAFKAHSEEYQEIEDPPQKPSDILLPPITAEQLAEVESTLGPLPLDMKEMALVANGFKGAWHFAGGGFPGVDELVREPAADYELHLGIEPPIEQFERTVTNPDGTTRVEIVNQISVPIEPSGTDWGPVYGGPGTVENDDFYHIVCPPETLKRIKGGDVEEGEYMVFHYAHWTDGPENEATSMRDWFITMTEEMEGELEGAQSTEQMEIDS